MVDVSQKAVTLREAVARARVRMTNEAMHAILAGNLPKGEVLATARIAGIQAAKRTSELIPMCHPLPLTLVEVSVETDSQLPGVRIEALVRCEARTGVEMEAMTAASVAALSVVVIAKNVVRRNMCTGGETDVQQGV